MSDRNLSQEILTKIKDTKPKPRWEFLLKNYTVWILGFVALLLASLSFATILYMMINNDWDIYGSIGGDLASFIFMTLPYFWLIFLALFVGGAYYNFKNTKGGYKFPFSKVVIFSVLVSMLFGLLLYEVGVGQAVDNILSTRAPFYKKFINPRHQIWSNTEEGFLAGIVVAVGEELLVIDDVNHNIWYVSNIAASLPPILPPGFIVEVGTPLRILGEAIDNKYFEAEQILPMRGMNWIGNRPAPPGMMEEMRERKIKGLRIIR